LRQVHGPLGTLMHPRQRRDVVSAAFILSTYTEIYLKKEYLLGA